MTAPDVNADVRARFEAWASDGGKFPKAVERAADDYRLMTTHLYWLAWQAAHAAQGRGEAVYQCMCTDPNIDEDGNKHEDDGRVWMDVSEDNYVALSKRPDVRARIVYTHPAPPQPEE